MIIKCSYCQDEYGKKKEDVEGEVEVISHGACPSCAKKALGLIRANKIEEHGQWADECRKEARCK